MGLIVLAAGICFSAPSLAQDASRQTTGERLVVRRSSSVLREQAIKRVEPAYPPLAAAAKVSGSVAVEVEIDEQGDVVSARAVAGHALLKNAAVRASRQWKFKPLKLTGTPVRVIGIIRFNFVLDGVTPSSDREAEDKSIESLESKVRDNPDSHDAHLDLGEAYSKEGRYTDAIAPLKRALELHEAFRISPAVPVNAHFWLAKAYSHLGDKQSAQQHYEALKKIDGRAAEQLLLDYRSLDS
jgi:TonB family protein